MLILLQSPYIFYSFLHILISDTTERAHHISAIISAFLIFIIILLGAVGHFFKSLNETHLSLFLVFYLVPHAAALRLHLLGCSSGTPLQFFNETFLKFYLRFYSIICSRYRTIRITSCSGRTSSCHAPLGGTVMKYFNLTFISEVAGGSVIK